MNTEMVKKLSLKTCNIMSSRHIGAIYKILFVFFLSISAPVVVHSQYATGFELDGVMHNTDLDADLFFDVSVKYNYWLTRYAGISLGGMFNTAQIHMGFDSPDDVNVSYSPGNPVININAVAGLKFVTPAFKGFSLAADANFVFSPIPFHLIDVDKRTQKPGSYEEKESTKYGVVYTRFNPSYSLQLSIHYNMGNRSEGDDSRRLGFALGVGMSNYNPYNAYYYAEIDGISLRNHLKLRPDKKSFMIFVRLTQLNLAGR